MWLHEGTWEVRGQPNEGVMALTKEVLRMVSDFLQDQLLKGSSENVAFFEGLMTNTHSWLVG